MRRINGYGRTIAFILTIMLPAPSLGASSPKIERAALTEAGPVSLGRAIGSPGTTARGTAAQLSVRAMATHDE